MGGVQMGIAYDIAKTPVVAELDPGRCDSCGECLKTCNVGCIRRA
jgi:ferredoxin